MIEASEAAAATAAIAAVAGADAITPVMEPDGTWLAIRFEPTRSAEINRALATAGIYASRVEAGTDLESFFLELTGGASAEPGAVPSPSATPTAPWSDGPQR